MVHLAVYDGQILGQCSLNSASIETFANLNFSIQTQYSALSMQEICSQLRVEKRSVLPGDFFCLQQKSLGRAKYIAGAPNVPLGFRMGSRA